MVKIIQAIKEATGLPVFSNIADENGECVIITLSNSSDNGSRAQKELSVRIITKSARRGDELTKLIKRALIKTGDGSQIEGLSDMRIIGGSAAWEPTSNKLHTFVNLTYYERSEVL